MHALLLHEYGDPPQVSLGQITDPVPGPGQILIRVHAAALNPIDSKLARGWMSSVMHFELPLALGWDLAGVVEAVDAGVSEYHVGQPVFGCLGPPTGSIAERLVTDGSGPWIAPLPDGLAMTRAAALPMVGLTALTVQRALRRDGVVLVIGASGGLGAFLVPLLARAGLTVLGTGAAGAAERVLAAGARAFADHRSVDLSEFVKVHAPEGADAVIDLVNQFDALQASAELLGHGGQLLSTLFGPDPADMARSDIELTYVRNDAQPGDLARVADLVLGDVVTPAPVQLVPFAEAATAFARLSAGTAGKLVINVAAASASSPSATAISGATA